MPEGHTLHRLARDMQELVGYPLQAASPQGRFAAGASAISGEECIGVEAFGKHLFIDFVNDTSVHVHLGMRGKFLRFAPLTGAPLPQVRLRLNVDDLAWDLIAPSVCEQVTADRRAELIASLGPDPLRDDADPAEAIRRIRPFKGSIAAALLEQSVISGVGNVFRAEALHACAIAPFRPSSDISETDLKALWIVLQDMMSQAVDDGRIVTVTGPDRLSLPEAETRRVYKQERCRDCGTAVDAVDIQGRTSYSCPLCQPA